MLIDLQELGNWNEYLKLFVALIAMVNPLDIVPIYLSLVKDMDKKLRNSVLFIGIVFFVVILSVFAFFGDSFLKLFEITVNAFRVAGGILLILIGIDMLRSAPGRGSMLGTTGEPNKSVGLVPLGVPLLAGPGAVSTVIVFGDIHHSFSHSLLMTITIIGVGILTFAVLRLSNQVARLIGPTGLQVFNRILGLVVVSIGVEFMLDGIAMHFPDTFNFQGHGE